MAEELIGVTLEAPIPPAPPPKRKRGGRRTLRAHTQPPQDPQLEEDTGKNILTFLAEHWQDRAREIGSLLHELHGVLTTEHREDRHALQEVSDLATLLQSRETDIQREAEAHKQHEQEWTPPIQQCSQRVYRITQQTIELLHKHGHTAIREQPPGERVIHLKIIPDRNIEVTTTEATRTVSNPTTSRGEEETNWADIRQLRGMAESTNISIEIDPLDDGPSTPVPATNISGTKFRLPREGTAYRHNEARPRLWVPNYRLRGNERKEDVVALRTAEPGPWRAQPITIQGGVHCMAAFTKKPPTEQKQGRSHFTPGPPALHATRRCAQWIRDQMQEDYACGGPLAIVVHSLEGAGDRWTIGRRDAYGTYTATSALVALLGPLTIHTRDTQTQRTIGTIQLQEGQTLIWTEGATLEVVD
eukprot:gene6149-17102_t